MMVSVIFNIDNKYIWVNRVNMKMIDANPLDEWKVVQVRKHTWVLIAVNYIILDNSLNKLLGQNGKTFQVKLKAIS